MILTNDFLNKVSELFEEKPFNSEHQSLNDDESKIDGTLIKADDNTILIKVVKTPNLEKKHFNDVISTFTDSEFQLILEKLEEITGTSLDKIENMFKEGRYDDCLRIILLALEDIVDNFQSVIDEESDYLK